MVNYVKNNKVLKLIIMIIFIPIIFLMITTGMDILINLGRFIGSFARNISNLYQ